MTRTTLSIDPGASGGISILHHDGTVETHPMPDTPRDLSDIIDSAYNEALLEGNGAILCYMEQVGGYVGGAGAPGSAMFSFGMGYGTIIGILTHAKIPFILVTPQKWQAALSCKKSGVKHEAPAAGMSKEVQAGRANQNAALKRAHKTRLKELAQRYFPDKKVTLKTCDSLLLLEYAKRQSHGQSVSQGELV